MICCVLCLACSIIDSGQPVRLEFVRMVAAQLTPVGLDHIVVARGRLALEHPVSLLELQSAGGARRFREKLPRRIRSTVSMCASSSSDTPSCAAARCITLRAGPSRSLPASAARI